MPSVEDRMSLIALPPKVLGFALSSQVGRSTQEHPSPAEMPVGEHTLPLIPPWHCGWHCPSGSWLELAWPQGTLTWCHRKYTAHGLLAHSDVIRVSYLMFKIQLSPRVDSRVAEEAWTGSQESWILIHLQPWTSHVITMAFNLIGPQSFILWNQS